MVYKLYNSRLRSIQGSEDAERATENTRIESSRRPSKPLARVRREVVRAVLQDAIRRSRGRRLRLRLRLWLRLRLELRAGWRPSNHAYAHAYARGRALRWRLHLRGRQDRIDGAARSGPRRRETETRAGASNDIVGTSGRAPLAGVCAERGVFEEAAVERVVESDALQTDTADLQRAGRVELTSLVEVLRGRVLARRERLLDERLRGLQDGEAG